MLEAIGHLVPEADLIAIRQRSNLPRLDPCAGDADAVLVDAVELISYGSNDLERDQAVSSHRLQLSAYKKPVQGRKVSSIGNSDLARPLWPTPVAEVYAIDIATGSVPAHDVEDSLFCSALQRNERDLVRRTGGRHTRQSCGGLKLGEANATCVDVEDQVRTTQACESIVKRLGRTNQKRQCHRRHGGRQQAHQQDGCRLGPASQNCGSDLGEERSHRQASSPPSRTSSAGSAAR